MSDARLPRISPWLSVVRGSEAVEFYQAAFGATELHRHANEAGEVVARLSVGGAEFWIADDPALSPEMLGGGSARMILAVDDPDALFDRAVAAGAVVIAAMYEGHGWRIGRICDPFGHHWEIGRPLAE
ncbi:MAG: PhnB protein [Gaiellales bacterium]|nr:PhnB protein [Gaiellales bacterium]MDX6598089.1 PhnB protein [Gaiellales bacterium]